MSNGRMRANCRRGAAALLWAVLFLCDAAPAAAGATGPYPGDIGQAVATVVVFLGLLFVLGKWAWKPIVTQLRQREERVAETVRRAEQREQKAEGLLKEYQQRLDNVAAEAQRLLAQAHDDSAEERKQVLADAREEAAKSLRQAGEDIARAKQEALRDLHQETAQLAVDIAGRALGRNVPKADHSRLVQDCLEEVRKREGDNP